MAEDESGRHRRGHGEYDVGRLLALSDGVFAIAMTLLVLDIPVPQLVHPSNTELLQALRRVEPNVLAFGLSFVLVGINWMSHRILLRGVVRTNSRLVWLNLFMLLLICLVPFTAGLMSRYGDLATAVIAYAANLGLLGLFGTALRLESWNGGLVAVPPTRRETLLGLIRTSFGTVVFGGSIPIALVNPTAAELTWLLLVLTGLLPGQRLRDR